MNDQPLITHKYVFYIETKDGQEVRWGPMNRTTAINMYNVTAKRTPLNVATYGWEELK